MTLAQVGAAASSHNHSAANITSGTLPITRGGTGATTAASAITSLGAVPATRTVNSKALSSNISLTASDVGAVASVDVGTVTTLSAGSSATVTNSSTASNPVLNFGIPRGEKGDAATLSIGTVATLEPGVPATVTNSGTQNNAVLNFGIPRGESGDGTGDMLKSVYDADGDGVADDAKRFGGKLLAEFYVEAGRKQGSTAGERSTAEGIDTLASGEASHAEGTETTASGNYSHAEGFNTTASGYDSHAEGWYTTASDGDSHAEGCNTTASGEASHAEGFNATASGKCSHAEGQNTTASGCFSHAEGHYTTACDYQHVSGMFNIEMPGPEYTNTTGSLFIIGKGDYNARANCFRVSTDGHVYGCYAYEASGADYAELFEWLDGNRENEDRRGRFVTLHGRKITFADETDSYVLGVISGNPVVLGNQYADQWQGMYEKDVFGSTVWEDFTIEQYTDERGVVHPAATGRREKRNPDYKPGESYTPRSERPEWDAVGMFGQLTVIDDGTCQADGYCAVAKNGTATASESGYRVLERIDETHVCILFR